ncbi:MAG: hypothetical protein WBF75_14285 [Pseudonocardiaceae bacterium]
MKGAVVTTTTWLDLRDAALGATRRGWPVTPGTYLGTDRRWHGRDNTQTLCPIQDTWADTPITDPTQAGDTWTHAPYGVLLVCGHTVAVLDLPITKADPETTLSPRLAQAGVRLYGASGTGAWVALPPTTTGVVLVQRWFTSPAKNQTRLPHTAWVQQILLTALRDTTAAQ